MKKWVEKLIDQFDFDWKSNGHRPPGHGKDQGDDSVASSAPQISEDRATVLFMIDTYNKHLLEFDGHPVRKTREMLDEFAKELIGAENQSPDRVLFRFRQFFSAYRIDECAYFQKTFEDFRTIIWDFVDQLAEDISTEQKEDSEVRTSLEELKEAVESNSIDALKNQSRKFIDIYIETQFKKDKRRTTRMKSMRKNLTMVQKQLGEATNSARMDHLTQAFNRKAFDEFCAQHIKMNEASRQPITMLLLDIDHFKRINDTYGHEVGDFVLKGLVDTLKRMFHSEGHVVARIGGEEFAVLLPEVKVEDARKHAETLLNQVRKDVIVNGNDQIRYTVSIGIAELCPGETQGGWLKRADLALYNSKNGGRDRLTVAPAALQKVS